MLLHVQGGSPQSLEANFRLPAKTKMKPARDKDCWSASKAHTERKLANPSPRAHAGYMLKTLSGDAKPLYSSL